MITCGKLWEWFRNGWTISIPHEVNNQFLWDVDRASKSVKNDLSENKTLNGFLEPFRFMLEKKIPYDIFVGLSDFWDVTIPPERLDEYIWYYRLLKEHLDEIAKIIPLPETIGDFDGWYDKWYVSTGNADNFIEWSKEFTKEDMHLLIDLIIRKALEAKKENVPLRFLWD